MTFIKTTDTHIVYVNIQENIPRCQSSILMKFGINVGSLKKYLICVCVFLSAIVDIERMKVAKYFVKYLGND